MGYLGNTPALNFISFAKQVFTIVNSQTAYTLDHKVTNENDIRLVINNVVQEPGSGKAYTASGTTLTLSAALVNGTDEMYCVFLGKAVQTVNAPNASVGSDQTAPTIITGQTAEATVATDDTILIHDTSASALRKMTRANFVSGIGGTNTPAFQAFLSSNQTISNNSSTKITINSEVYDTASAFNTSTNRFTPQTAGKYIFYAQMTSADTQTANEFEITIKKNGTTVLMGRTTLENFCSINTIGVVDMNGSSDYVETFSFQNSGGNAILTGNTSATFFGGYKIIE